MQYIVQAGEQAAALDVDDRAVHIAPRKR